LIVGNMVIPWIPMALVVVAIQTLFVLGVGLLLSVLNVYFRDVKHLMAIVLQALFYSAPIVYPMSLVPEKADLFGWVIPLRTIYELNPLVTLVETYRDVLYDLRFPPLGDMAYLVAWSVGVFAVGLWVFNRLDGRLAEEV
jgi:ABC-type polysaccharide/polyol phosphate export permease